MQTRTRIIGWIVAVTIGSQALPAHAEGPDKTLSPYFQVSGGDGSVDAMPLLGTDVDVQIVGVIADVRVKQTYKNDGATTLHATYVFPASTRAAVHGLTMRVGNQLVRAQIKEREEAKRTFEQAKREGKSASLLEEDRPNVFRMSVANILPGDKIEVELLYSELIVPTGGTYEFVYPTVVGPRYSSQPAASAPATDKFVASPYLHQGEAPASSFTLSGRLTGGMPIDSAVSPSHEMTLRWKTDKTEASFGLRETADYAGDEDFVLRYRLAGGQIQSGLLMSEGKDENFFLLTVQPPKRVDPTYIPPRDYVFVLDVSGSMRGFPLDTAKELLRTLMADLKPTDTFNVLFFSGGSDLLSPTPLTATPRNIDRALKMIERQDGGGGTELLPALERAMALPAEENGWSRSFIVVTDGYISGERELFEYIRANLGRANVFSFGIGSSVNRFLIDGVAKAGLGEPFVVLGPGQSLEVANKLREYVRSPVLTDVKVTFDGFDAYDVEPTFFPDVLADRPIVVHGKWKGKAGGSIGVRGVSGAGAFQQKIVVAPGMADAANEPLKFLWARTRVSNLSDFTERGGLDDRAKREVTELGLKYELLTAFTSFIAVHEVVRNPSGEGADVAQPLPLPEGVTDAAVGDIAQGAEPELVWIAMALAVWAMAVAWRRKTQVAVARRDLR